MTNSNVEIQKRFDTYEDAFNYASELSKRAENVTLIKSIDGYRTEQAKVAFYVENTGSMIRNWESVEHFEKGKKLNDLGVS